MSAAQKLLDMINRDNPGANLVLNDVVIAQAEDNTNTQYQRDTTILVYSGPSRRFKGSIRIWYNRLDLNALFLNIDPSINYEMPVDTGIIYTTHHILPLFNEKYGLDLQLADVLPQPLTMVNGVGRATIMAAPGNPAWKGFVEFTFGTSIPSLSQVILTTTLTSFNLIGDDPTKGQAAVYSYNLNGTDDPDLFWQQLNEGQVTEDLVEHFNLLQGLGATWVYNPTPSPYNLYGATVDYSGDNEAGSVPSNIIQPLNPVFDNVAIITLSATYCVNFAGKLTVYSNDVVIVEPTPDWHTDHYTLEGVVGNNAWLTDTQLFIDSSIKLVPEASLVANKRPLEVHFDISDFGIDAGSEGGSGWTLHITAHNAADAILGSVDVTADGVAILEIDNHDHDIAYFQFNDQVGNGGCYATINGVALSGIYVPPVEEPEDPENPLPDLGAFVFRMVPTNEGFLDSEHRYGNADPDYTVTMSDVQGSDVVVQIGSTLTLEGGMPSQRQIFRDYSTGVIGEQVTNTAEIGTWDRSASSNGVYKEGGRGGRPAIAYYDHVDDKECRRDLIIDEGFDEVFFGAAFRNPAGKAFTGGNQHWPNSTPVAETFIARSSWKILWCDYYDDGAKAAVECDFILPSYAQGDQFGMYGGNSHSVAAPAICSPSTFWHFGDGWNCGRFWIKNNPAAIDTGIIHQEWFTPKATLRAEGQGRILDNREEAPKFTQAALCKWIEGNDLCQIFGGEEYVAIGANAPCRIEVGDHPDYYKCRALALVPPKNWDTVLKRIVGYRNTGDFEPGKPQFVFVIGPNNLPVSRYGRLWNMEAV